MAGEDIVSKPHFQALDALRGIAAVAVMLFHINWIWALTYVPAIRHSYLMVDFFFVLSGFVIAYNYFSKIVDASALGKFIWLRFWRLYPLHLVTLLGFLTIEVLKYVVQVQAGIHVSNIAPFSINNGQAFVENILLLQAFPFASGLTFNLPSWSISAEFYTYLLFALVVLSFGARRIFIAVCIILAAASFWYLGTVIRPIYGFDGGGDFRVLFPRAVLGFFLGVLAFIAFRAFGRRVGNDAHAQYLQASAVLCFGLMITMLSSPVGYIDFAFDFLAVGLVLSIALTNGRPLNRALTVRPLAWLGKVSYSIYMVHLGVMWVVAQVIRFTLKPPLAHYIFQTSLVAGTVMTVLFIALSLVVSHFTFHWIEEPFRLWSKRALRPAIAARPLARG